MSNLGAFSMWDLFRGEVESQMRVFTDGLLAIEGGGSAKEHLASTMRAAHSIKGAARIVHLDEAVQLSHSMEDCLVAAQEGALTLEPAAIDILLSAGDLLAKLGALEESAVPAWVAEQARLSINCSSQLADVRAGKLVAPAPAAAEASAEAEAPDSVTPAQTTKEPEAVAAAPAAQAQTQESVPGSAPPPTSVAPRSARPGGSGDRTLKVGAQTLNRLMGLAGESLVQSRWFEPFSESLLGLKRRHSEINTLLESLQASIPSSSDAAATLGEARRKLRKRGGGRRNATRNWTLSEFAPRDFRIGFIERWWQAGCGPSGTASRVFHAWFAISRGSWGSKRNLKSSVRTQRWTAKFWIVLKRR